MRITVYDVPGCLATGMTFDEIIEDFPELTKEDIQACLHCASDSENIPIYSGLHEILNRQ